MYVQEEERGRWATLLSVKAFAELSHTTAAMYFRCACCAALLALGRACGLDLV